jgi:hypothetical protein
LSLGRVAELADALASGASGRKVVGVQVPPRPPRLGLRPALTRTGAAVRLNFPHLRGRVGLDMIASQTFDGRIQLVEYVPRLLDGPPGVSADA